MPLGLHAAVLLTGAGGVSACTAQNGGVVNHSLTTGVEENDKLTVEVKFIAGFDRDYGYVLRNPNSLDHVIFPKFFDDLVRKKFDAFFDQNNLIRYDGKKIFCICRIQAGKNTDIGDDVIVLDATFIAE